MVAVFFLASCGYIGDPLPPLANVPVAVTDLAAIQRGDRIIAHFSVPLLTTEGRPIPRPITFDLRIGSGGDHFDANEWAGRARHVPAPDINGPLATYEIPTKDWTNQEVVLGVRVTAANGKQAGWSNFAIVQVVRAPATPSEVNATAIAQGVRLTWRAAGNTFRVLRKADQGEYAVAAEVAAPEYTDTSTEYGTRYSYLVQTIVKLDGNRQAESDLSAEAAITPVDTFPPAVPSGLAADISPNSVELRWERNTEPDLAGYRIYRALGDGAFEKLAEVSQIPTYSDRAVEHGKTYRYSITSVDRAGNESARAQPVAAGF